MSICKRCQQSYEPETITWARNTVLDEEAQGRDPNIPKEFSPWYGDTLYWMLADVEEYEARVDDGTCYDCEEAAYVACEAADELMAPCPPAWFDPADCGESWDEI